jgi:DNA-binding transcriptional MerR regulator
MHAIDTMMKAGCTTARGIRHWEDEGMLGTVERSTGGDRRYTDEQLDRAKIIAAAQFGGWSLDKIKEMLLSYDTEVYEALLTRLADQARACVRLGDQLPRPPAEKPGVEYDL